MKHNTIKKKRIRRDCWDLDYAFYQWLRERLPVYLKDAGRRIDLEYHKFEFRGKEYTQKELIERLITITDTLLGDEDNDYWDLAWLSENMLKLVKVLLKVKKYLDCINIKFLFSMVKLFHIN